MPYLLQGEKVAQPVQIKEAKVTVTPHNSCVETNLQPSCVERKNYTVPQKSRELNNSDIEQSDLKVELYINSKANVPDTCMLSQPVIAFDSSPVIREAKNIRTDMQTHALTNCSTNPGVQSSKNDSKMSTPQPPPYHIAAAYSLQAQFFNSYDCSAPGSTTTSACSQAPNSPTLSTLERNEHSNNLNETYSLGPIEGNDNDNKLQPIIDNENNVSNIASDMHPLHLNLQEDDLTQTDYKPRTFIQDKPSPGQNIVAPTPKRPGGPEKVSKIPYLASSPSMRRSPGMFRSMQDTQMHLYEKSANSMPSYNQFHASPRSCRRDLDVSLVAVDNNNMNRGSRTKIPAPSKLNATTSENNATKWVFGQHKNATVVQVTLQRSPDLGFTITENDGKVT